MELNQEVGREGYGWMILQNGRISKHMVRQKGAEDRKRWKSMVVNLLLEGDR